MYLVVTSKIYFYSFYGFTQAHDALTETAYQRWSETNQSDWQKKQNTDTCWNFIQTFIHTGIYCNQAELDGIVKKKKRVKKK